MPLAVIALDVGGHVVAFKREDGCGNLRFDIARGKAAAALGMGMSTRLIRDRLAERPAFQSALAAAAQGAIHTCARRRVGAQQQRRCNRRCWGQRRHL